MAEFSPIFWFLYSSGTAVDLRLLGPAVCRRGRMLVVRHGVIVAQSLSPAKRVLAPTAH